MNFECLNCGESWCRDDVAGFSEVPPGWLFAECEGSYDHEPATWVCSMNCAERLERARHHVEYHQQMMWEHQWRLRNVRGTPWSRMVPDPNVPNGVIYLIGDF